MATPFAPRLFPTRTYGVARASGAVDVVPVDLSAATSGGGRPYARRAWSGRVWGSRAWGGGGGSNGAPLDDPSHVVVDTQSEPAYRVYREVL